MALRSTWKGTVSCGLLNVPAKLYAATEEKDIHFASVHKECKTRVQMPKMCPTCNRKVEASELLKGYELDKDGSMVLFDEGELDGLKLSTLSSIEVLEFVPNEGQFDPRLPKKAYFLGADKGGVKGFSLLCNAMEASGVVAIAKLAMRQKEHMALLRPYQKGVMLLQTLFWEDELRPWGELITEAAISDAELELAGLLIRKMHGDGNLNKYKNEYREALERAIEAKLNGEIIAAPDAPKATLETDLAALLKASL